MDTPTTGAIIATGNTITTTEIRSTAAHGWYSDDLERGKPERLALTQGYRTLCACLHPIAPFSTFPPLFNPRNFVYFRSCGILELYLRVIRCNTCSSIIVSTHRSKNVQLITDESK